VVVNLLLNARDAMSNGGSIRILGEQQGSGSSFKVLDEGNGIPAKDLTKIFDPFFTTKGKRGTGLGLSIARGVLARLGGDITAENRPGRGSMLHALVSAASEPSRPPAPRPPSVPAMGFHVLIIDDDTKAWKQPGWPWRGRPASRHRAK